MGFPVTQEKIVGLATIIDFLVFMTDAMAMDAYL